MYEPNRRFASLLSRTLRRIPQAVGTIAICSSVYTFIPNAYTVSIPQAVSTIAMQGTLRQEAPGRESFNTASGKYYCN